jgi:hypothetical protein
MLRAGFAFEEFGDFPQILVGLPRLADQVKGIDARNMAATPAQRPEHVFGAMGFPQRIDGISAHKKSTLLISAQEIRLAAGENITRTLGRRSQYRTRGRGLKLVKLVEFVSRAQRKFHFDPNAYHWLNHRSEPTLPGQR